MRIGILAFAIVSTLLMAAASTPASALDRVCTTDPVRLRRADVVDGNIKALRSGRKYYERTATVRVQRA